MVPVDKYIQLKAQEKAGKQPMLKDVTEVAKTPVVSTPEKESMPVVDGKKELVFEEKRKPGLPTKAELKKTLDDREVSYTPNNCWKTLDEKYIKSN